VAFCRGGFSGLAGAQPLGQLGGWAVLRGGDGGWVQVLQPFAAFQRHGDARQGAQGGAAAGFQAFERAQGDAGLTRQFTL